MIADLQSLFPEEMAPTREALQDRLAAAAATKSEILARCRERWKKVPPVTAAEIQEWRNSGRL
jgi:hypothetical protein